MPTWAITRMCNHGRHRLLVRSCHRKRGWSTGSGYVAVVEMSATNCAAHVASVRRNRRPAQVLGEIGCGGRYSPDRFGLDLRVTTPRGIAVTRIYYLTPVDSIADLRTATVDLARASRPE
ncbi:hypothetical protein ACFRAQ_27995 [Nocardia sp. NPDC056611]|uniref:hypothetical protein n=1 Tax=Nocardia sp. NPDC056611 TaxID=3345877 RepID=UPI0036729AC4